MESNFFFNYNSSCSPSLFSSYCICQVIFNYFELGKAHFRTGIASRIREEISVLGKTPVVFSRKQSVFLARCFWSIVSRNTFHVIQKLQYRPNIQSDSFTKPSNFSSIHLSFVVWKVLRCYIKNQNYYRTS